MQVDEPEASWAQEIENMRIALEKLGSLTSLSTATKDTLTQFKASLKALSPQNKAGYEALRRQIHSVFGIYGIVLGKELKLKRQATAGNYQLEMKAGTFSETKKITIREDPLLDK
jgi:phage FluMu protein gp41